MDLYVANGRNRSKPRIIPRPNLSSMILALVFYKVYCFRGPFSALNFIFNVCHKASLSSMDQEVIVAVTALQALYATADVDGSPARPCHAKFSRLKLGKTVLVVFAHCQHQNFHLNPHGGWRSTMQVAIAQQSLPLSAPCSSCCYVLILHVL